jgi:GAF domain-containing protein/methyl-accepting chemotaxis protein
MLEQPKVAKIRRNISLTTTLATAFVVLSIVPLVLVSGIQAFLNFQAQQELVSAQQQVVASRAAQEVSDFFEQLFNSMESTAQIGSRFAIAGTVEQQRALLESLLGLEPNIREVAWLDEQGNELVKLSRLAETDEADLTNRGATAYFLQTIQDKRYISPVWANEITNEPLVTMAVPIRNVSGNLMGVLVAEVDLKFMWDLVNSLRVGETGVAYVVDRDGNLIAFRDILRVLAGENVSDLDEVAEFLEAGRGEDDENEADLSTGISGQSVVATYVPLGTPDWAVIVELPAAEAYKEIVLSLAVSIGGTLIIAVLAGVAGVYLARHLAAPVHNLTETVSRIAGGETRLQARVEGSAEVAQLAEAFNGMTSQLHFLLTSLEEQVQERTAELALSLEVGQQASAIRNLDELLPTITEFIRDRFQLYYTHVYFVDDIGENLVIKAGTGDVGRQLLARHHSLPVGPGSIVGRVAAAGQSIVVTNTETSDIHKPNPLLPDTRSELAVPLVVEGRVLGVLDMQSDRVNTFTRENLTVFEATATQLAIAIDSAQQWTQSQAAQRKSEEALRQRTREVWAERLAQEKGNVGYTYDLSAVNPVSISAAVTDSNGFSVPLVVQSQQIGRLAVEAPPDQPWTEDEQDLLSAVAQQLAQKAENLRLFEQTQERAGREQLTRQIADKVRASRDIETALKTAAEELSKVLGTTRAVIDLNVESGNGGNGQALEAELEKDTNQAG